MATFDKKVGSNYYYHIDNIRAAGILPYYIKKNKVYILVNTEFRNNKVVYNSIGGKVDKYDSSIEETMVREFNEETGYLVSDIIKKKFRYINKDNCLKLTRSKYLLHLLNIKYNHIWKTLPYTYYKIFKNVEKFNHRESISLEWVNLFDFDESHSSFLLKMILNKIRNYKYFKRYNPDLDIGCDSD